MAKDETERERLSRILEPGFGEAIEGLSLEEVRHRRDDCLAEREYLSYLRRLLHGRLEILGAEMKARADGVDTPLVERLAVILGGDAPIARTSRGEALRVGLPDDEIDEARRRVEGLAEDSAIADPTAVDEGTLVEAIETLTQEERVVSGARRTVMDLHDRFQDELKRRYKERLQPS